MDGRATPSKKQLRPATTPNDGREFLSACMTEDGLACLG
jgi:hypothetical protein